VKKENRICIRNCILLLFVSIVALIVISKTGAYPYSYDSFGHLFKGNMLYEAIKSGKLFMNYDESWYNGIQPFRYWAPFSYYILAIINLFTNNIIWTYNIFMFFIFIIGGLGWICWGYQIKRQNLALVFALLWFFVPNNLRVLFSEGNLPFVLVNALIPFVFLFFYKALTEKKLTNLIFLAFIMFILTLTHAMLAAMIGISLFIFSVGHGLINKHYKESFVSLVYAFMGIMCASFWLYPALKGGIMAIDSVAVSNVMKDLTYPIKDSLNPFLRLNNNEIYYYGLAFAFTAFFGLFMSPKKDSPYFLSALLIFFGTSKAALPFLQKLPVNQLFWMNRFTSISMAMIVIGLLCWKGLRKNVLVFLLLLLVIDSAFSFKLLGFNGQFPDVLSKQLDLAANLSSQRVAVLDGSQFGSFPSFYTKSPQVYGWAWQGAGTAENIVLLNTALENGYYEVMFDRALELGADTLLIKKDLAKELSKLEKAASAQGYMEKYRDDDVIIYKYPVSFKFGTKVSYEATAIGKYASNLLYIFPKMQLGISETMDDYTFDELKDNKTIFLSGFKYKNKKTAEELILKLSRNGVRVVIDSAGLEESFLGVSGEVITIKDNFKNLYYKNQPLTTEDFPQEYSLWKTTFLRGIENMDSYQVADSRLLNYIGNMDNENLIFMGLNLPYYSFLTKNTSAIKILEDSLNLESYELPERTVHKVEVSRNDNVLTIRADSPDVVVPVAALDAFVKISGDYETKNNLIYLKSKEVTIGIIYPYAKEGFIISLSFVVLMGSLTIYLKRKDANIHSVEVSA